MKRRFALGLVVASAVLGATLCTPELRADIVLDPQPDFQEFHTDAAVRPNGGVLLVWTRQQGPSGDWSAMAATLDSNSGELGELHEWGVGDAAQVVPLGTGYLALREQFDPSFEWFVERLDEAGQRIETGLSIGYGNSVAAHATPDGGAVVVAAGSEGGGTRAWRFGPDGSLLAGPTTLAEEASLQAAAGVDANGNLVVVWTDQGTRVFSRRFSPSLEPLGPVVPVALGGAYSVRLAVAPDGRFVAVYDQSGQLWAVPFHADGTPAGKRLRFAPRSDYVYEIEDLGVAIGQDGRILVVWKTYVNSNIPTIRSRVLSLAGRPLGRATLVSKISGGRGDLLRPRVESLPAGDFLVLWTRVEADGQTLTLRGRRLGKSR
jgi:hypothetical protein